jgi:hypothetical protein
MPVLLLAQGEPQARDLLRRAIEARYGLRPPVLDSLKLNFHGRTRVRLGPVNAWVPVSAEATFRFPDAMRWDFTVRPLGLPVQRGVEAYDGHQYYSVRGGRVLDADDAAQLESLRRRLWAIAAMLLTPLSNTFVRLHSDSDHRLIAINTHLQDSASITLRPDRSVEQVEVTCVNADGYVGTHTMRLSEDHVTLGDLILPTKVHAFWNNEPHFEVEAEGAVCNPSIESGLFRLEDLISRR